MWATFDEVDARAGDAWESLPLLSVSQYRGVIPRAEIDDSAPRADDLRIYKTCIPGDVILNRMSAYKGAVGVSRFAGLVSPDYLVMRPRPDVSPDFLVHLIKTPWFVGEMSRLVRGIGSTEGSNVRTPRIGRRELGSIKVDMPPKREQIGTVAYLDREAAEIDAFIADQEVLIGLLTERRGATISYAVTKGLDTSASMKDSGSSALGDIPSHWKPAAMRRVVSEFVQGVSPQAEGGLADAHSIGVLRAGCVNGGTFNELDHKRLSTSFGFDDSIRVRLGDVIVNRASGSPKLVGSAARVRSLSYNLILSDKTFRLSPADSLAPDFLELFLNSAPYRTQVLGAISGAEGLANNLPMSALKSMTIPIPPLTEQVKIAEYLQRETAELDAAIADARESIALSRERRAALISAAVTGKIDIRGAA
ncbi:hypothetical protein BMW26_01020 [Microbacterium sp. 1.5R]|uniref:restriction endonuclease subunit S n=1 Tax=Microbacterium sp. 1.5R TaxID=1916917 RepID=UPI00090B166A|nr:restriction endonuclease subunit S [Microbacterium sp. 1.5R]APH43694.1 hypothetical protein BMW26_01020 [Microbacterium sp. 1.5R]